MTKPLNFTFLPTSGKKIELLATAIISHFQPEVLKGGKAFDIHRFVDTKLEDISGVTPVYTNELPSEIFGLTDSAENRLEIQASLAEDPFNEKFFRSTLAHETGHCLMHVPQLRQINRTQVFRQAKDDGIHLYRKDPIPLYCNPEWQAWRFAGALLMPEAPLRMMLNEGAGLPEIAGVFEVNIPFLKTRLKALKIQK
jgi:hypothetical protein